MIKHLYSALPFLRDIDRGRQEQFETYFRSAPLWLMEMFQVEELKSGDVFIREGDPADTIFFVGRGTIEATDYRVLGTLYDYMRFDKVYAFGGMEFIMELDSYMTTLRAVTDCTLVKLPRPQFEKWMYSDMQALRYEAKLVCEYLNTEARHNRVLLFLEGADRLALLLVGRYEQYSTDGVLLLRESRQRLANESGLCVKSVNRGIQKFLDDGLISKEGTRIIVDRAQHQALRDFLSQKVHLDPSGMSFK